MANGLGTAPVNSLSIGRFDDTGGRNAFFAAQRNERLNEVADRARSEDLLNKIGAAVIGVTDEAGFNQALTDLERREGLPAGQITNNTSFRNRRALLNEIEGAQNILKARRRLDGRGGLTATQAGQRNALIRGGATPPEADLMIGGVGPSDLGTFGRGRQTAQAGFDTNQMTKAQRGQFAALRAQGLSEQDALGIVSRRFRLSTAPTGERVMVDVATNEARPVVLAPDARGAGRSRSRQAAETDTDTGAGTGAQPPRRRDVTQARRPSLFEQAGSVTGAVQRTGEAITGVTEQLPIVGFRSLSPKSQQAIRDFELERNNLIRTLSLNPRFPIAEQERIRNLVTRGVFTSEGNLQNSLVSLDGFLRSRLAEEREIANDLSQSSKSRQEANRSIVAIERFLDRVGVPIDRRRALGPAPAASGQAPASAGTFATPEEFQAAFQAGRVRIGDVVTIGNQQFRISQ